MNFNNKFVVPVLENRALSQKEALEIYRHYLTTERTNYLNKVELPCKTKTYNTLCALHNKFNLNPNDESITNLVNARIKEGGKVYFWSDIHFYHSNIIRYANRPFDSIEEMHNSLIKNYLSVVRKEDLVIIGGDISFAGIEKTNPLLNQLPGEKVWVLGNHDFERRTGKLLNFNISEFKTMAFVFHIEECGVIKNFIVSHYPIDNKWLPKNTWNIHGHTHQYNMDRKNINISVEAIHYTPIELRELTTYRVNE